MRVLSHGRERFGICGLRRRGLRDACLRAAGQRRERLGIARKRGEALCVLRHGRERLWILRERGETRIACKGAEGWIVDHDVEHIGLHEQWHGVVAERHIVI